MTKLADLLVLHDAPDTSVFAGMFRLPPGQRLDWSSRLVAPEVVRWFRPEDGPPVRLRLEPTVDLMRRTIRDAVRASLPADGDVAATLSGGLDSSTVVATAASLLHPRGRTVHTVTHVPLPGTEDPTPVWEADDGPYASRMAREVPGLTWQPLVNSALVLPIEAVAATFSRTWLPSLNPVNTVWLDPAVAWAGSVGSRVLLTGAMGNGPFSRSGDGILARMARSADYFALLRQVHARHRSGQTLRGAARSVVSEAAPQSLKAARRRVLRRNPAVAEQWLFAEHSPVVSEQVSEAGWLAVARMDSGLAMTREEWIDWLLFDRSLALVAQDLDPQVWWSDPLSDPELVTLAVGLPEELWIATGVNRGLAREVAKGLVPEHIRLRRTIGSQGADVGVWMAGREQAYRDALDRLRASAAAGQFIDVDRLSQALDVGLPIGADAELWEATHGRAFGLGLFAAWYEDEVLEPARLSRVR